MYAILFDKSEVLVCPDLTDKITFLFLSASLHQLLVIKRLCNVNKNRGDMAWPGFVVFV